MCQFKCGVHKILQISASDDSLSMQFADQVVKQ